MLGNLLYELLTAGHTPYHWLLGDVPLLLARLQSSDPVPLLHGTHTSGAGATAPGLRGKHVLEAAAVDGVPIPWALQLLGTPGAPGRLAEAQALVGACCKKDPADRLTLPALAEALQVLWSAEVEEARAAGLDPGRASLRESAPACPPAVSGAGAGVSAPPSGVCDAVAGTAFPDRLIEITAAIDAMEAAGVPIGARDAAVDAAFARCDAVSLRALVEGMTPHVDPQPALKVVDRFRQVRGWACSLRGCRAACWVRGFGDTAAPMANP